jgi:preprotein translocase subunit SecE
MAKETPTNKTAVKGDKKKRAPRKYFRGVVSELKKVSWPSRKELTNYTIIVIVFILLFAVAVGVVDLGLGQLLELITMR